jgi:hypothetical protein
VNIPNIVGDSTEVDVSFSPLSDPTDYFEFIQVRDREGTQGRPWIEQLLGQRQSLMQKKGIMVSTTEFSSPAKRLAGHQNIPLRLLLPETEENTRLWYTSDVLGLQNPLIEIDHCSLLIKRGDRIFELAADRGKSSEKNILFPTETPNKYKVISLRRVFDVDVMHNPDNNYELMLKLPKDEMFHKASIAIEYKDPRLFLNFTGSLEDHAEDINEILPISAIVFFVEINRRYIHYPITHRFKYIDAQNNVLLAQAILSEVDVEGSKYYSCLVRHHIDQKDYGIGGGFFR